MLIHRKFAKVVTHIASHGRQLQAADQAWSLAALRAQTIPWRALLFQVAEITRQKVRTRSWCNYSFHDIKILLENNK